MPAQIFIKGTRFDVMNSLAPSYFLEIIDGTASGSRSYNLPPGCSVQAQAYMDSPTYSAQSEPSISVSGNTVSWSGNSGRYKILVWAR